MTILEAIDTAIGHLEAVRLPVRDTENVSRVTAALQLLDALRATVDKRNAADEAQKKDPDGSQGA